MPPTGIAIPEDLKAELSAGVAALGKQIESLKANPVNAELLPDVQVYHNAVRYVLEDNAFYRTNDFADARKLLSEGLERARLLSLGQAPWGTAKGLVVRGYLSQVDGSVQPYGLLVPDSYAPETLGGYRLDFWYHGRNGNLTELAFITDREKNKGEFAPANTFVLHPYGRYCNANKFAGETDTFEALEHARRHYHIDDNRISVRGFSMGGAATWHIGAHYAGRWAAVNPGAGFVDTAIFQKLYQNPRTANPPWYVQRLWHLYDVTDYSANFFNSPVIAYSGEIDAQKQAADLMSSAMAAEGLDLVHIIGPNTPHRYEPKAKAEVARMMDEIVAKGRNPMPQRVRFTTWTLRYNQMEWVTIDGMARHWERARVEAQMVEPSGIILSTTNVTALTLTLPAGLGPFEPGKQVLVVLDRQGIPTPPVGADRAWTAHFQRFGTEWHLVEAPFPGELRKRHGLQGPIDDAFMDSFLMVRSSGKAWNEKVDDWSEAAYKSAAREWRLQFRGEPRVKFDFAVTDEDIAKNNLILWGDPGSNELLRRILRQLPIHWDARTLKLGPKSFPSASRVPVLIFPNPLNPEKYVVINSGFTFADEASTSNALQIPKLPDYAILDLSSGEAVEEAGFFDENWHLSVLP